MDMVRTIRPLQGEDPYGDPVTVPAGEVGTVIVGRPEVPYCHVDFDLDSSGSADDINSVTLVVAAEDLELVERAS
jgi:hypothetical protein